MVNGRHAAPEPTLLPGLVTDKHVADDVQTIITVAADGRKEMMAGVTAEKIVVGADDNVEELEEEEDVYSMDISDELLKKNRLAVKGAAKITMASAAPELGMNGFPKEDLAMTTGINESASESGATTERVPAEIHAADGAVPRATASSKEDVSDLNESPKLELEIESEVTIVNEASPTPVQRDVLPAVRALEVPDKGTANTVAAEVEVVERAGLWPSLDVNEPLEVVEITEDIHSDVTAFRVVEEEEADSLHDLEIRMVVSACGTSYTSGGDHEFSRAVMYRESDAAQVASDSKKVWQPSGQTEESSRSRRQPNAFTDILVDSKDLDLEGVPPKEKTTELEREIEMFESSEREEQARLLGLCRGEQQREEKYKELQNDKKRSLELPLQERQRKLSRKMQTADERKKDEEDVCFICFDGGDLVLCDRRYGAIFCLRRFR